MLSCTASVSFPCCFHAILLFSKHGFNMVPACSIFFSGRQRTLLPKYFVNEVVTFMFLFVLCLADCTIWLLQMLAFVRQI